MPGRRNLSLRNDDCVADGAVLTLGLAGGGAGGFDRRVNDFGVPLGWNLCLCNDNLVADRAVLTLGLAGLGAGRSLCCVNDFGVSLGGNHFLCNDDRVADRAMLTLGLAGLGAGRCNCRINDFGVSLGGNHFLCNDNLVADGAVLALGQTRLRAGSLDCWVNDFGVSLGGNRFLCNDNLVANRAMLARALAGLGAGRCNCRVNDHGVSLGGNNFLLNDDLVTDGAVLAFGLAGCGAGSCNSFVDHLGMALGGDFFHTGENRLTNGALRTGFMTSLGAGSGLFRNFNRSMSSCVDCFGLGCIANCAGVGLDTGVQTGRRGRDLALIPAVALGRNGFTRLLYFITNLAIGIAGVAFLSAGRLTATTNLGQRVVILPAGFEGQVGEGEEHILVPFLVMKLKLIEIIVANSSGDEPTVEVIAFTGGGAFGKRVILAGRAVDDLYRIHRTDAAVGVKGDGELFKLVELRLIVCVLMNILGRIAIVRIPTPKLVSKIVVLRTLRNTPIVGHCVLDGVVTFLQDRVIPVEPADMVLVQIPLGVEGNIFAGGDVCLVGIGRAGAVNCCVPTDEVIVRAGEGVGGQGSRLAGLHGLSSHGSIAVVGVEGDDRVLRPLGIKGGIRVKAHDRSVGIVLTGAVCLGIPAGEGVVLTGKGVLWQINTRIGLTCPGSHRSFAAVGVKVNSDVRSTAPYAIQIGNGRTHAGICRLGVRAVGVVQLGGCDGDRLREKFLPLTSALRDLICLGLLAGSALLVVDAGTLAGADVRAALRGVDAADGGQLTVDVHLYIRQRRTLTCPSGGISYCNERLIIAAAVAAPLIHVIDVDALAAGHHQLGTLSDAGLYAGQQRRCLVDGQLAAGGQIDGHVVGQRQNVAAGVNRREEYL